MQNKEPSASFSARIANAIEEWKQEYLIQPRNRSEGIYFNSLRLSLRAVAKKATKEQVAAAFSKHGWPADAAEAAATVIELNGANIRRHLANKNERKFRDAFKAFASASKKVVKYANEPAPAPGLASQLKGAAKFIAIMPAMTIMRGSEIEIAGTLERDMLCYPRHGQNKTAPTFRRGLFCIDRRP